MERIEERLSELETVVGGHSKDTEGRIVPTLLDSLTAAVGSMQAEVDALIAAPGNETLASFLDKMEDVSSLGLLTPLPPLPGTGVGSHLTPGAALLATETKVALVEAGQDAIDRLSAQLEEVGKMADVVDSQHIADAPRLAPKLAPLQANILTIANGYDALDARTKAALVAYNDIVALLSQKFVAWDARLSALEH